MAQQPLQTELLHALDASHARPGSPVITKVLYNWIGQGCSLASGSTASGAVVEAHIDKPSKQAAITVRLDTADCNGKLGSRLPMRVFAIILAPPPTYERAFADAGGLFGSYSPKPPAGGPGGLGLAPPPEATLHRADLRNDATVGADQANVKLPKVIQANSVFGDKTITLESNGPDGTSIVHEAGKSLRLEAGTKLVLMPARIEPQTLVAKNATPAAKAEEAKVEAKSEPTSIPTSSLEIAPLKVLPKDETEVCTTGCSVESARTSSQANAEPSAKAGQSIAMAALGYSRADRRELYSFHHAYTLTYLDAGHLLFTFDLHAIRLRQTGGLRPDYVHTVRAVLVDPMTRAVLRIVDWQVIGEDQYLWPASTGRVLVHLGHELRLLDTSLKTVKSYALPGLLTWVSVAPGGKTFAAGLLQERHTEELHRKLVDINNVEPEESIEVAFLDANLQPLGTSTQPSTVAPPVLSPKGELRVLPMDSHQWELEEFGWDKSRHRIAVTVSDCQPRVSLPTDDTLFLAGCTHGQNWYRALRWDGHTIVRGAPSSQQLEQAAEGDITNDAFAVRVVWSIASRDNAARFSPASIRGEQVGVYRVKDGQRLLMSDIPDVPLTEQSFALSPDARQLAVMGINRIYLYRIGTAN